MLVHPAPSADVFSIAVMLATWLLGHFPYEGDGDYQIYLAQLKGNHAPLPKTLVGEVLGRCLRVDPTARPPIAELEQALRPN
jgi:serine/threonine protein kinase